MRAVTSWFIISVVGVFFCLSAIVMADPPTHTISGVVATDAGTGAEGVTDVSPIISGHVNGGGTPIEGVLISSDNDGGSAMTDANGYYEIRVPYGWSGTITPSKEWINLIPANRAYSDVIANISNEDYDEASAPVRVIEKEITGGYNDGYAWSETSQELFGNDLRLGNNGYPDPYYLIGLRFIDIDIPKKAEIISSTLHLYRKGIVGIGIKRFIAAESSDNPENFSGVKIGQRPMGPKTAYAYGTISTNQWHSANISSIIASTIKRSGWESGNPIVLLYATLPDAVDWINFSSSRDPYGEGKPRLSITYNYPPQISGYIKTSTGIGIEAVTVAADDIATAITDSDGYYELRVPPAWSGTVVPSKAYCVFSSVSHSYSNLYSDRTNQDFLGILPLTVSGTVTDLHNEPTPDVIVSADNEGGSATTSASGFYELPVPYGWSGTVTASKAEWAFEPNVMPYSNLIVDADNQNITSFAPPIISGYIQDSDGIGVENVLVDTDDGADSDTTTIDGYFELTVPQHWSGTITPNKDWWGFDPNLIYITNIVADVNDQNFTGLHPPVISGYIKDANDIPVEGVDVSTNDLLASTTTDSNGYYEITVPYDWSGLISTAKPYWFFSPDNLTFNNLTNDISHQNFLGINGIVLSGYVSNQKGIALSDIQVELMPDSQITQTDSSGYYEFVVPPGWSGDVGPISTRRIIEPVVRMLTNVQSNQSNLDFVFDSQIHVKADSSGDFPTIQAAIDAAVDGDHVIVHPGQYSGYQDFSVLIQDKSITLQGIDPDNPEIIHRTVIDGQFSHQGPAISIRNWGAPDSLVTIDGLTITGCIYAPGIYCYNSNPIIRNCVITENLGSPGGYGGGICCIDSNAIIENCVISKNAGGEVGPGGGINIQNYPGSPMTNSVIRNCIISNNYSLYNYGGGIGCRGGSVTISNCTIAGNFASGYFSGGLQRYVGRGVFVRNSNVNIYNSIIWDNMGFEDPQIVIADSIYSSPPDSSRVSIAHSNIEGGQEDVLVFSDNDSFGGYIYEGMPYDPNLADPNTLIWRAGNIDVYPLFAQDPNHGGDGWGHLLTQQGRIQGMNDIYGEYHLKSEVGRFVWDGFAKADFNLDKRVDLVDFVTIAQWWNMNVHNYPNMYYLDIDGNFIINEVELLAFLEDYLQPRVFGAWVQDDVTSPCIDAGDLNDLDWQNELWPHGKRINMGAYGGTTQASMSLNDVGNPADLNHDDAVDIIDWGLWSDDWLDEQILLDSDFDRNNVVDPNDMGIFLNNWLTGL